MDKAIFARLYLLQFSPEPRHGSITNSSFCILKYKMTLSRKNAHRDWKHSLFLTSLMYLYIVSALKIRRTFLVFISSIHMNVVSAW